jgi:DNA replication protein DnaC
MSKYYDKQLRSRHIAERRHREVTEAIPEMAQLDRKIRQISLAHARSTLTDDTSPVQNPEANEGSLAYGQQIQDITNEKEALLVSHGFPADYLKPVYECADCHDTGYTEHGRCHCFEKEIVNFLYSQSNLQDILEHENFNFFNLDYYPDDYIEESTGQTPRDNMRDIYKTATNFVQNFEDNRDNLLLYGNTGVGKTFLANCIAKELLDQSYTVVYLTSLKLFDILETYKFDRQLTQAEKNASVTYILDSDLLIIDDLGTELNNTFTSSQLYRCIDTRLNHGKSTVISTNLSFDDLREQYSERIFSRITSNYTLLKITGDDIRLKKALS